MKKIALFVEGQTEQIFIERLIREMCGNERVSIISKRTQGGTNAPKQELVRNASFARRADIQVLIYDCGADNRVKSEIIENIPNLTESGYTCIVGLRDLYPLSVDELPRLEAGLRFLPPSIYKKYKNPFDVIVIVQEIETWFLAETHHLQRVDRRLTGHFIDKKLGFNPYSMNAVHRKHPAKDLNDIYQLVGRSYTKKYWQVHRLVNRLDFDHLLRHIRYNVDSLDELVTIIERFKAGLYPFFRGSKKK